MLKQLIAGQVFPSLRARNIHGSEVCIPPENGWIHLQFRRFAGCPICNLHLQSFVRRNKELNLAGIREVVVFHSSDKDLLPYQGQFPFDVIGDPSKKLYKQYGVGSSPRAVLSPGVWLAALKGNLSKEKPKAHLIPTDGVFGLPADFLIAADGITKAVHYGKNANDQWSVNEMMALTKT